MLRLLTLTTAVSALALTAAAQPAPAPQTQPVPPVNQSPPVTTDPQDPATQDDTQSPSSTSAMPDAPAQPTQSETAPAQGAMQRPSGDTATTPATPATPQTGATAATPAAGGNIVGVLRANGQFTTLLAALDAAQLTSTLDSATGPDGQPRSYTLFAPTDAAFAAVPEAQRTALMADPPALQRLLLHHVFGARVTGAQLRQARGTPTGLQMADNNRQAVTGEGDTVMLGAATVTQADIAAGNGVIHAVDAVIMPAGMAAATPPTGAATPPAADSASPATTTPPTGSATPPATTPPTTATPTPQG